MQDLAIQFKETLKDMEKLKQRIMRNINEMGENEQTITRSIVYPVAKVNPLIINNYPVFQFGYDGMLPIFKEYDYEYYDMIRLYYYRATFDAYNYEKLKLPVMSSAVIIFTHYFSDNIIRDLDNRNKKFIQDAIRQTRIINNDHWKNVWNMDVAFFDKEKSHVQVYVVERENLTDFMDYLMKNHEILKGDVNSLVERSLYEEEYLKNKEVKEAKQSSISSKEKDEYWW